MTLSKIKILVASRNVGNGVEVHLPREKMEHDECLRYLGTVDYL